MSFRDRYGPWALVAGASEGLGAAFAEALAARGLHLVLLARRADKLEAVAAELVRAHGVDVRTIAVDLGAPGLGEVLVDVTRGIELGLAVYNAAYAPIGLVTERPLDELLRVVDVNVRGPVVLARTLAPAMVARGRGGLVLMSSIAGFQGAPKIATYAASKAFTTVLGEGLWREHAPKGVDVVVSCAGAIRTPSYRGASAKEAPGTLDAADVAAATLDALGKAPTIVPGATNQLARFVLGRVLPRRAAIAIMAKSTEALS
ncbi:SDR family NAD(P)-dependent oxidoreductase [Myxococcota bacterium]|nr:SDR family NAD(P)-dependent oxidoreductase [Myxococcota bacterium]